jgi:hypothetical protein
MANWHLMVAFFGAVIAICSILAIYYAAVLGSWWNGLIITVWAQNGTAIGTLVLAFVTYWTLRSADRQRKRDRLAREMESLILPLLKIYRELDSRGFNSDWWNLYITPLETQPDRVAAEKFREAIEKIDENKYLAPKELRRRINDFLLKLMDMKRSVQQGFLQELIAATKNLYEVDGVKGGFVERRAYELTKELDSLNESMISKIYDIIHGKLKRFRKRPPKLLANTSEFIG